MNNRGITGILLIVALSLLLVALPFVSACAPTAPEEEVAPPKEEVAPPKEEVAPPKEEVAPPGEKVIKIGNLGDVTGPAATGTTPVVQLSFGYIKEINEKGGINGVKLEQIFVDTKYDVSLGLSGYKRCVDEGVVVVASYLVKVTEAIKDRLPDDQVPAVSLSTSDRLLFPPGWVYCHWPSAAEQCAAGLDWFMRERWEKDEPPVIAFVSGESAWEKAAAVGGTRYAKEKYGITEVYYEFFPYGSLDITPNLLRVENLGVDWVWSQCSGSNSATVASNATRLGLKEKIAFMGPDGFVDAVVVRVAGEEAAEGLVGVLSYGDPWREADEPGLKAMLELAKKYGQTDVAYESVYRYAYTDWMIIEEVLKRALDKHGYPITGAQVKEELDNLKDFDTKGLMGGPITYTPDNRRGCSVVRMCQMQSGKQVPISGWFEAPRIIPE